MREYKCTDRMFTVSMIGISNITMDKLELITY